LVSTSNGSFPKLLGRPGVFLLPHDTSAAQASAFKPVQGLLDWGFRVAENFREDTPDQVFAPVVECRGGPAVRVAEKLVTTFLANLNKPGGLKKPDRLPRSDGRSRSADGRRRISHCTWARSFAEFTLCGTEGMLLPPFDRLRAVSPSADGSNGGRGISMTTKGSG